MDWVQDGNSPDLTSMLNIENLSCLILSHCKDTDSLFNQIPLKCPVLNFLLQDCQEITEEAYTRSHFKTHRHLKVLNVASNRNAHSPRCVIEILKHNNGSVLLDIRGHRLTQMDFVQITREHPNALARIIKDAEEYGFLMMPYTLRAEPLSILLEKSGGGKRLC